MSHQAMQVNGVNPDAAQNIDVTAASMLAGTLSQGNLIGCSQSASYASVNRARAISWAGGGPGRGNEYNGNIPLVVSTSPYPNFLEWGGHIIADEVHLQGSFTSQVSPLLSLYASGATQYYCGFKITDSGCYRLEANWCPGALTLAGSYVDVQWRTSTGVNLGSVARFGNRAERKASCLGYFASSTLTTVDVGLWVIAISSAVKYNINNFDDILITAEKI